MSKTDITLAAITAALLLTGAMLALNFEFIEAGAFLAGGLVGLFSLEAINGGL
jgi:hypothetical protein